MITPRVKSPGSYEEAAEVLARATREGRTVRARGGGTKYTWGSLARRPDVVVSTRRLKRIHEHNEGDLTAVLDAGVRLHDAQAAFARAGQMLALDPPLGARGAATIGGVVATADSGPLRHRYGGPRDLVLGMTVALGDGTLARTGGKVIKNVAGYDLAKLFAGSFGTLGVILQVVVRLHPRPRESTRLRYPCDGEGSLARAALALAQAPLELEALEIEWERGRGAVTASFAGVAAEARAARAARLLEGPAELERGGNGLDRDGQRECHGGAVLRVGSAPGRIERTLAAADARGARVTGRVLGPLYVGLPADDPARLATSIEAVRADLAPTSCVLLDAPREVRERVDVWGGMDEALARLHRRVKDRFDPGGVCAPGIYAGGI